MQHKNKVKDDGFERSLIKDRPSGGERVILVHVHFPVGNMEEDVQEFTELARSAGATVVNLITGTRRVPDAKYFVGSGKVTEIQESVCANQASLVIFNHVLSPSQERNIERAIHCRVVDRTGLILDIFAQRARSFEGKLQVELALLRHLSTRLVRGWTHLERQRGGIGLRGPGETQLEVDRRLIRNKIKQITLRLNQIRMQREQSRRARKKATLPTIALVGYTNAGKSTLFNALTGSSVYAANQLFATLDPTLRRIEIPHYGSAILADTVGFIRHLPRDLIQAFHATLEEVSEADLLLHLVDVQDESKQSHIEQVENVLKIINADKVPRLLIYNKIDLMPELTPQVERDEWGKVKRLFLSAASGAGFKALEMAMSERLGEEIIEKEVVLTPAQAKLRAILYSRHYVVAEEVDNEGSFHLSVQMPRRDFDVFFNEVKQKF
jgi:GTP-binding protein HflX